MMMRIDDQSRRPFADRGHGAAHLLAVAQRGTAVDDDQAARGDDEAGG
jgi:hypothetical protein